MIPLNASTLSSLSPRIRVPAYDRSRLRVGIVHLGVGNFFRVHQAPIIDDCLSDPANGDWAICGVGLTDSAASRRKAEAFARQDNLYTVTELTPALPRPVRVVGAMTRYLHAPSDPEAVLRRLADPGTRIVSLTITEGGYGIGEPGGGAPTPGDAGGAAVPRTAFDFIVEALDHRRRAGLGPFTVMSCDNLSGNGEVSRAATLHAAEARDPGLAAWIAANATFPNSMVDRIAPQISQEDRGRLNAGSGIEDLLPASCETFTSWVIEDAFCAGRPPLETGGVEFRSDVAAFVAVKGRLSNAAHMLMCYPSLLIGYRLVDEAMRDARIPRLLQNFWDIDAVRLVEPPSGFSVGAFTSKVLDRFADPAIGDSLLRVAHDGAAKIDVFHARTIEQVIREGDPTREAFLFASFWRYLGGVDDRGRSFEVKEPRFGAPDRALMESGDPLGLLATTPFRKFGLEQSAGFVETYLDMVEGLASKGAAATLDRILVRAPHEAGGPS